MPDEIPPRDDAEVRRLLAAARHEGPVPTDVADRLDRVLAQLAAGDTAPGTVTDLAARRRRRASSMLIAAAAVVAVGVGLGQVIPSGGGEDSASSADSSGATSDEDFRPAEEAAPDLSSERRRQLRRDRTRGSTSLRNLQADALSDFALVRPLRVRDARFSDDVARARRLSLRPEPLTDDQGYEPSAGLDAWYACEPSPWGDGDLVPVTYDGEPAVLVLRGVVGDTQVVDLFQCGGTKALRSTTLPAR